MCLACEEADMYYRWQLIQQIAKGEMPEGPPSSDSDDGASEPPPMDDGSAFGAQFPERPDDDDP